ncbi:hypothetical protein [Streptosporangium sp. NPDC000396]
MTSVLVVDDEPQILRALRINLVARNFEVAAAVADSAPCAVSRAICPGA